MVRWQIHQILFWLFIQLHFQILKGIYFPESIYITINQRSSSILCCTNIDPIIISYSNCSFFCVSEYFNNLKSSSSKHKINYSIKRGSHWSLLIYNKCFITWIVSIKGANEKHARQMAKKYKLWVWVSIITNSTRAYFCTWPSYYR